MDIIHSETCFNSVSNTENPNQENEDRINNPQLRQRETVRDPLNTVSPIVRFRENPGAC